MKKLIMPLLALIVCWGITGDLMAASKRDLQRKRHLDDKKNEVKWYALDGTKWYAFDVDGLPIAVNQEELNRALRMRPQIEIGNLQVQRIGYDDASVVRIQRHRF